MVLFHRTASPMIGEFEVWRYVLTKEETKIMSATPHTAAYNLFMAITLVYMFRGIWCMVSMWCLFHIYIYIPFDYIVLCWLWSLSRSKIIVSRWGHTVHHCMNNTHNNRIPLLRTPRISYVYTFVWCSRKWFHNIFSGTHHHYHHQRIHDDMRRV